MTTNRPAQESMQRVEAALSEIDGMTAEKVHLCVDAHLCENSDVELACRISVSISSLWKPIALATSVRRK